MKPLMLTVKRSHYPARHTHGFTIVELLIVIIVIAILAAITIVTYSGIQQRANNSAIVSAASQSMKMIQSYIAVTGNYPATSQACITTTSGCLWGGVTISTNSTFNTNIATNGNLPLSVPNVSATDKGVFYGYTAGRTMNGAVQPAVLIYHLSGAAKQCGLSGVTNSGGTTMISSTTGYTVDYTTTTICVVSIPGPSA